MNKGRLEKILFQEGLSRGDIIDLLKMDDPELLNILFKRADQIRIDYCGTDVHFRGVVEISNYCEQNCFYCEMREDNFSLKRYRMTPEEIFDVAREVVKSGIYTVVLQAGEDSEMDVDIIAYLIYSIKKSNDIAITLSLGERQLDEYKAWKIAGADRYILKHETCNEKHYSHYRNKKFLTDRIQNLKYLKRLGFQIGSGNIVGLPKQSLEDIADDILLLKELNVDIVDVTSFIPYEFTPFQNLEPGELQLVLKTIAISRILLKDVHIHAITPRQLNSGDPKVEGLSCGANVVLTDFTPANYRGNNQMLPFEVYNRSLKSKLESFGRTISYSKGDSLKNYPITH